MMNTNETMNLPCVMVPRALFMNEISKEVSMTAKMIYSLLLEKSLYAEDNGWVDEDCDCYVIYPKSEMAKDLNCSQSTIDRAIKELDESGMLFFILDDGKPNRYYLNDMRMPEERDETNDQLYSRGFIDEKGKINYYTLMGSATELGHKIAFNLMNENSDNPEKVMRIYKSLFEVYEERSKNAFMTAVKMLAEMLDLDENCTEDMEVCALDKMIGKYYLRRVINSFCQIIRYVMVG
jgi:hypothetical protein